ncbi:unnamed protein product [Amoebophrya sp. A25]|nr:unnamed protein product [Amoebophrya sp. A25]|eukprot:GSA25T00019466001.1
MSQRLQLLPRRLSLIQISSSATSSSSAPKMVIPDEATAASVSRKRPSVCHEEASSANGKATSSTSHDYVGKGLNRGNPLWIGDDWSFSKEHILIPNHYHDSLDYVLLPKGLLNDRIEKLAIDMRKAYGDEELHILCVLKGSRGFFSKLLEIFDRIHKYSQAAHCESSQYHRAPYMEHYVRLKSYHNTESTGKLHVQSDDLTTLSGKHVLIVEDIIDTGNTLTKFCDHLKDFAPKSIKIASLLEKRTPKSCGFLGDWVGFSVPDVFIVGYCLDYNEHFRDLDHVCVMNKKGIEKYKI